MKVTTVYVCNRSSLVTDKQAKRMVAAINSQLEHEYQSAHSSEVRCKFVAADADELPNTVFLFDDPDAAGALGYHDETPGGNVYGKVFTRINGVVQDLFGPAGISVTLSHEVLELAGNPNVNKWFDMPGGKKSTAGELCDAVEGDSYPKSVNGTDVYVSNFLWPEWFDPEAPAGTQCDQMDTTPGPFQFSSKSPGTNYMIVRDIKAGETQVFGADGQVKTLPEHKQHPAGRTARILKAAA
jgi:hypothetical protein